MKPRKHVLYWLWLSLCISPGSKSSDILLEHFDEDPQKIYEADASEYDLLDLSPETKAKLQNKSAREAKEILLYCKNRGIRLLAYDDPEFPKRLRTIGARPVLLYAKGKHLDLNSNLVLAMVGTRRMTAYGERQAYSIAHDLCSAGAIVASGLALGVDAVCHRGALDATGETVAVLGCGIDITYPKGNYELFSEIERKGMLLTEYKPGTSPMGRNFPTRNRIISGISAGTLVVEGDLTSGALITAKYASDQGRDLYALPGMVGEQNSEGTNYLLKEGATVVTKAADLLCPYIPLYPNKIFVERIPIYHPAVILTPVPKEKNSSASSLENNEENESLSVASPLKKLPKKEKSKDEAPKKKEPHETGKKKEKPSDLDELSSKIYDALLENGALSLDELTVKTGGHVAEVMTALTILEIRNILQAVPGGRFVLK